MERERKKERKRKKEREKKREKERETDSQPARRTEAGRQKNREEAELQTVVRVDRISDRDRAQQNCLDAVALGLLLGQFFFRGLNA